ncbi:MAG: DNA polymerase III subunit alpha [Candidatus Hydrogenedentales bacterium]
MIFPLEVHSCYSMLQGTAWPRQLVARAVEYGIHTLPLTDTGGLYGALPFYQIARDAGIKAILGARLGPWLVLARDRKGYADLCALITAVHLGAVDPYALETWPFDFDGAHLFLISDQLPMLRRLTARGFSPLAGIVHYGGASSRRRAELLLGAAKDLGIRPVALYPVYFLNQQHYRTHRVLTAIRENTLEKTLPSGTTVSPEAWFCTPKRIEGLYSVWPETLDTLAWIGESCNVELSLGTPCFPNFSLPSGETPFSWLWKHCFEGLRRRYRPLTPKVLDRAHHELNIIHDLGFAPYFLIVSDIVHFARHQDIPAVGRGSAANSLVAYALGITRVDPFKYNLYFERFLNRSRKDCPDIDLDLCWRGRDRILDYVYNRYGSDHVAMISTINTFRARASIRETAKAFGFTGREIGLITQSIPHYGAEDLGLLLRSLPECRHLDIDSEPLKSILETSQTIAGLPRHLATHACGTVIAPEPLTHYVPLERAARDIIITQFDKDSIETLGLVKMDLLGHRALSAIRDTVHAIRRNRDAHFDIESIPDSDSVAAKQLVSGHTIGCFQVESPAMRGLLRKLQARSCMAVIQAIALVRPGASGSGMKQHFIDRCHGHESVHYPHPSMEAALGDSYGVMIYQEDVLKVAHAVAGMSLEEADLLRRAMSKKRGPREMARIMKSFLEGAAQQGVPESCAQEIWELIANFASYAYCKAHAATYGELAYQCVWLKAHYPVEYFSAVLANGGGFYAPLVYVSEARRCGVPVLPPDVNYSALNYAQEGDSIRMGFAQILHVSEKTAHGILAAREKGLFRDVVDLLKRVPIGMSEGLQLCQAGALDSLSAAQGIPRPVQFWQLQHIPEVRDILFDGESAAPSLPAIPDVSARFRADSEQNCLGQPLSSTLLRTYGAVSSDIPLIASRDLPAYAGRQVTTMGTIIAERRLPLHKGEGIMKFLSVEDAWGVFEAVLFSESYRRFGHLTHSGSTCLYIGSVCNKGGDTTVIIERILRTA